ncbi:MAG TPA: hypothetical protein VIY47_06755 [Ignavibacteriaceae bacterium]
MKIHKFSCPFCGTHHLDESSLDACFLDPTANYSVGDLLLNVMEGTLFRVARLDKRNKNLTSEDVEVERFVWKVSGWGFGKQEKVNPSFWCSVRKCTEAQMREKIESTRKLLDLEEMLLSHLQNSK